MSLNAFPDWSCVHVPRDAYYIYQSGSHADGNFIRAYVPESASSSKTKPTAILYLHGFALCMPSFYEDHLIELVKQGYVVFFPDFQRSFYPNTPPQDPVPSRPVVPHLKIWLSASTQPQMPASSTLSVEDTYSIFSDIYERSNTGLGRGLSEVTAGELRRVARALVVIIALLNVFSWFRREYGKNLIHLLSTVGLSLVHRPTDWLRNALHLTEDAWEYLCSQERYVHWAQEGVEPFAFGHSLGGLIALSLPSEQAALKDSPDSRFLPKLIVTADPAVSTEMGIPKFAIWILKIFKAPFTASPITIQTTGKNLEQPVVILHGGSDKLVLPKQWVYAPSGKCSNYEAIASQNKAIYFSYSNPKATPSLEAFHNQAVTSTQYYDDALFRHFGGVKDRPNAYNKDYVWQGVNKIFGSKATPKTLLSDLENSNFQVKMTPPAALSSPVRTILTWLAGISLLFGAGYEIWKAFG